MANFRQITPFMHVPDLEAALRFFQDILGFNVPYREGNYAYIEREGVAIRILEDRDPPPQPGDRRFAYYIDVHDGDGLYAELKPRLDRLPPSDVHGPADKPYNQRELLVLAPDGNLIAFGQATAPGARREPAGAAD
jgi:catechol 2,3-dioxygenase-like lactoylglutathione lyase family enzyme